jgi:hypothetical protein
LTQNSTAQASLSRAPGFYWIARHGDQEIAPEIFSYNVQLACWNDETRDWTDECGPDYSFSDDDTIVVLSGPLSPPAPPPPRALWGRYLLRYRWYLVFGREMAVSCEADPPNGDAKAASAVADREVPEYREFIRLGWDTESGREYLRKLGMQP